MEVLSPNKNVQRQIPDIFHGGWGIDISTPILEAAGQDWIDEGEERSKQLQKLCDNASSSIELALLGKGKLILDPTLPASLERAMQRSVDVSLVFSLPNTDSEQESLDPSTVLHPSLLDLKQKYPDHFTLFRTVKQLSLHFVVADGKKIMMDRPHSKEDLPTTVFYTDRRNGQTLESRHSQIVQDPSVKSFHIK